MPDFPLGSDRLVVRSDLLRRLKQSESARLTLVVASAGYGKTTLLSEWTHREAPRDSLVWHTLVEADNDPTHLLAGLIADVRSALPDPTALPVVDETQSSLSYPLSLIFRRAAEITHQDWLILIDDYQLITNSAIHQALDSLLNLPTWPVRLVIASRTLPPLTSIARLRVEGRLLELDEQDLRFTPVEAADLFEASGLHLKEPELDQVIKRTEGWAAVLRLVCQAAQREVGANLSTILDRMGDERHLFDYLAGQVLNHQPTEVKNFLYRTSLLPYLDVELCNAFLGIGETSAILDALERSRLFITRLAEEPGRRYRYHALFQEFLRRCLEQAEGAQAVRDWHQHAAQCFLEQLATASAAQRTEKCIAALPHLLAAQDWEAAAEIFETVAGWLVDQRQLTLMKAWFDRLPREVMSARPRLLLALSMLRDRQGQWSEALDALAQAERGMAAEGELPVKMLILCRQGWIHARQGHYAQAKEFGHQALALMPVDEVLSQPPLLQALSAVCNLLGACYCEADDIDRGHGYYQRALEVSETLGDRISQAKALHNIAMNVHFAQGRLAEAFEFDQRALRIYDEMGSYLVCGALCGLGYGYLARGDYDQARAVIERLLQLADEHRDAFQRGYALTQLGHVHREHGRREMALTCYEEARTIGDEMHEPDLLFEPRQGLALLALDRDDPREALRQAQAALEQMQTVGYRHCEGLAWATLGLVMDKRGDRPQAEASYGEALSLFQKLGANLDLATVHLYLADLYRRDGRDVEALDHLGHCLSLSQRYNYDFLFTVKERSRAIPLLVKALTDTSQPAQTSEILRLLSLMGQDTVVPLLNLLESDLPKTHMQEQVIHLLGEVGDERAVPVLDRLRRHRPLHSVARVALQRIAERPAPTLRVSALGSFQVLRGSALVPVEAWQQRRKTRLLLLYLLTQRHRQVSRDELLEALWPDLAPESAGAAFNTTSSDLRKLLEPYLGKGMPSRYIAREGDCYSFNMASNVWYDAQAFEQAVQTPHSPAHSALDLYRGDFLPEEPYLDWVVRERERLRSLYLNTLMSLLGQQVRQGMWHAGIDLSRRILEREPWLEEAWRSLMTCYARSGRRSEALQAYLACERSLQQELDVPPSPETRALYEQLKT